MEEGINTVGLVSVLIKLGAKLLFVVDEKKKKSSSCLVLPELHLEAWLPPLAIGYHRLGGPALCCDWPMVGVSVNIDPALGVLQAAFQSILIPSLLICCSRSGDLI